MRTGTVLIVDDDEDLRSALGDTLKEIFGVNSIAAASVPEMMALEQHALACDVAIIDINLGNAQPSGIDAFEWLTRHGFSGRVVFLTGHARSHPLVEDACRQRRTRVYQKPLTLEQLGAILHEEGS
jgi:DNA-binding NtrC family response regulator